MYKFRWRVKRSILTNARNGGGSLKREDAKVDYYLKEYTYYEVVLRIPQGYTESLIDDP